MPAVKALILGWVVLGACCLPADAASTQWWAWNRAWWSSPNGAVGPSDNVRTVAGDATAMIATPPSTVVLYAVQREWMPVAEVPASIQLYTIPGLDGGYGAFYAPAEILIPGLAGGGYSTFSGTSQAPTYQYDALVNLGEGPYASEATLTNGGARPWYESPVVKKAFGGQPNADQRAEFTQTVLGRVEQAFERSGVTNISLTANPMDSAAHSLSVVSGTEYGVNPDAIGITNMNGDGFSFIDKLSYASTVDELQWAVAHNVAHELMHAFGVEHHDTSGNYLDSAVTPWEVLVDPNTVFGPDATQELLASNFQESYGSAGSSLRAQHVHGADCQCVAAMGISPSPVPEPASLALWAVAGVVGLIVRRRVRTARAAG